MNLISFNEQELPYAELEVIGLASKGALQLTAADQDALFSGRRTSLLSLKNLEAEGIQIREMDAKISLQRSAFGLAALMIHPVYRKAHRPVILQPHQALQLETGEVQHLLKSGADSHGDQTELLIAYDQQTREYVVSDTQKILVPDMINGQYLSDEQKERYRKGMEVELEDNTRLSYSGVDRSAIRSNKMALVASVWIGGALRGRVYSAMNPLFGEKHDLSLAAQLSPGYYKAMENIQKHLPLTHEPGRSADETARALYR